MSWLFSLTDVPEVNATQFFPGSHDASTYPSAPAEDVGRAAPRTAAPAAPTGALLFLSTLTHRGQSMGKDHQARVFGYVTSRKGGPKAPKLIMPHADFVSRGFSKVISPSGKTFGAATLKYLSK